ncbi:MAG: hypothetical protein DI585_00940 [Pseudomonas fluorescens]|nr:MAG: hypothetical protein DI585_00940 [Pseudomonas fluorescens]
MSLPMRLFTLILLSAAIVLSPSAQERAASSSATAAPANQASLLQKISYLTQLVKILEDQLQACSAGQGVTCPSVLMESAAQSTDITPAHTHAQTSAPAPVAAPVRRHTIGYQQTSDSRLGCDDYSLSYFRRHPAMAAVCGVNAQQQAPAPQPSALPEADESDEADIITTPVRP